MGEVVALRLFKERGIGEIVVLLSRDSLGKILGG